MTGAFFDGFYARDPTYYGTDVRPEFLTFLDGLGAAEPAILDLGAGQGRHALVAARRGARVTAVDHSALGSAQLAARARANGLRITAEQADVTRYQAAPEHFDGVVMVSLLSHLDLSAVQGVVDRAFGALAPGGQVFCEVFTTEDPGFHQAADASETAGALHTYFAPGSLKPYFAAFEIVSYREFVEDDFAHGPAHRHGVALLVGRKR
jgi:cyclopropane fatty-acyl-phospholipid synthase-like methyltransferase